MSNSVDDDQPSESAVDLHRVAAASSIRNNRPGRIVDADLPSLDARTAATIMELQLIGWWHRRHGAYLAQLATSPHPHPLEDLEARWALCTTCGALIGPS